MPDHEPEHIEEFLDLIGSPSANENAIQSFMEAHSAYMPTPNSFSRGLHLKSVITKFPIGDRTCDYAYLAKTSVEWELTLVELEDSSKRIFKPSSKNEAFTSEFNDAVAQIDVWRDYIEKHEAQIRDRLRPLLVPPQMATNRLSVRYMLIIGRSDELEKHERRRQRLASFNEQRRISVHTYDTVRRMAERGESKAKAVLRATSRGFAMQSAEASPEGIFAYVGTEHLELSASAEQSLRDEGYDIDAWKAGRMLGFNERYPIPTDEEQAEYIRSMVTKMVENSRTAK